MLTLLLYGALGGAMFFLPFLLIQVHGYFATRPVAAFLRFIDCPCPCCRAGEDAWWDSLRRRLPLIVGPRVVAWDFFLLSDAGYRRYLLDERILRDAGPGLGMAITVAPLTTTVLNSVAQHQTGDWLQGINNAVAQDRKPAHDRHPRHRRHCNADRFSIDTWQVARQPQCSEYLDNALQGFVMPACARHISGEDRQTAHAVIGRFVPDTISPT